MLRLTEQSTTIRDQATTINSLNVGFLRCGTTTYSRGRVIIQPAPCATEQLTGGRTRHTKHSAVVVVVVVVSLLEQCRVCVCVIYRWLVIAQRGGRGLLAKRLT